MQNMLHIILLLVVYVVGSTMA